MTKEGLLNKEDEGHGKVYYSLTQKGKKEARRILKERDLRSVTQTLIEEDEEYQTNLLEPWISFAHFMLEHALENQYSYSQMRIRHPERNKERVFFMLGMSTEEIDPKFTNPKKEDFYLLPTALLEEIRGWNTDVTQWNEEKKRLKSNPLEKTEIEAFMRAERREPSAREDVIEGDVLTS